MKKQKRERNTEICKKCGKRPDTTGFGLCGLCLRITFKKTRDIRKYYMSMEEKNA